MSARVVVAVHYHEGRYHGTGDWPPAPARVFQALVAGAGLSGPLSEDAKIALEWLEGLDPPTILAPRSRLGQRLTNYVPNNEAKWSAVKGKAKAQGASGELAPKSRTPKVIQPHLFDASVALIYAWPTPEAPSATLRDTLTRLASGLFQLGAGVDAAWANVEFADESRFHEIAQDHQGALHRPASQGGTFELACPTPGSLESLVARYDAAPRRLIERPPVGKGKPVVIFTPQPRPRFQRVGYEAPAAQTVFRFEAPGAGDKLCAVPLDRVGVVIPALRDRAAARLRGSEPQNSTVERALIGRKRDGADASPAGTRVRIIPLPSTGHFHADLSVRRVLVEAPPDCPLDARAVREAFSGLDHADAQTGEVFFTLVADEQDSMARHYGVGGGGASRLWQTVTPVALPAGLGESATRDSAGMQRIARAMVQAARHADLRARVVSVRAQREPFQGHGVLARDFAPGTRFDTVRLWHVEVEFSEPVQGPLVLGDGRFLGLGVMEPVRRSRPVHAFTVTGGLLENADPVVIASAMRRALMARVQTVLGRGAVLPAFFSGHGTDGAPARVSDDGAHLAFAFEPETRRVLVIAPHVAEHRVASKGESYHLQTLDRALDGMTELRAGSAGVLSLAPAVWGASPDTLVGVSREWRSVTPYRVTRHAKGLSAVEAFSRDIAAECQRAGLPSPTIDTRDVRGVPGVGLVGLARLTFAVAVEGPIVLGKDRHLGGGLFVATDPR